MQFISPSVTPRRQNFNPSNKIGLAHNPGIRLYKYNVSNIEIIDYTQYYMDLPEVNKNDVAEWKLEYTATEVYGLPDLLPASIEDLVSRMRNRESQEFGSFYRFWTVKCL